MFLLVGRNLRVYTRFMELSDCFCARLRLAAAATTTFYDKALAPVDLSLTMYRLLRHLGLLQTASITDLAASLQLERSTLGRNLKVVEKRGLVEAIKNGAQNDKRQHAFRLTPQGHAVMAKAIPLWRKAQSDIAILSEGEAPTLMAQLITMTERLEAETHEQ